VDRFGGFGTMGFGMGQLYTSKYFGADAKAKIESLVANLRTAFRGRIKWLEPPLTSGAHEFSGAAMVSALWRHGPTMLDAMRKRGTPWPRFNGREMSDLIAFLNSKGRSRKCAAALTAAGPLPCKENRLG
jgi:hypothetical protein